jgi:LCP family protein required for cell wall assembly
MDEQPGDGGVLPGDMQFDDAPVRRRRRRSNSLWARKTRRLRHWIKEHKALSVLIGIVLLLLLILLLWLLWLWFHLHKVDRFEVNLDNRPPYYGGQNILLVGLDCDADAPVSDTLRHCNPDEGTDLSDLEKARATGNRSDVIMVLHVSEDGTKAQLVSIPRDSYVEVPGHGRTKINAAFSYGGPSLLAATVEKATGLYITHMAVVDFHGFKGISNAIGGVQVYVKDEIKDPHTGQVAWRQGWQTIKGDDALTYVRTRYGLPRGDFDRVQRHQNFLRAVMQRTQSMSVLANPSRPEAIHIIREVAAEFERPVLLFSGGKDSIVMLRLAEKAFRPAKFPFPVMHVDTGHNFPEVIEFRDRRVAELGERLIVASVQESIDKRPRRRGDRAPRARATGCRRRRCSTRSRSTVRRRVRRRPPRRGEGPRQGAHLQLPRRVRPVGPEEPAARAVEPLQRPHRKGEHIRVFPISNWTELDVWQYIAARSSSCRRSTSRTSARCSSATGCSTRSPTSSSAIAGEEPFESRCASARRRHDLHRRRRVDARRSTRSSPRSPRPHHRARRDPRRRPHQRGRDGGPQAEGYF